MTKLVAVRELRENGVAVLPGQEFDAPEKRARVLVKIGKAKNADTAPAARTTAATASAETSAKAEAPAPLDTTSAEPLVSAAAKRRAMRAQAREGGADNQEASGEYSRRDMKAQED